MPENMTHESHFREMLQALHHSLVLEDMRVKQVKTVSTFTLLYSVTPCFLCRFLVLTFPIRYLVGLM